MLLIVLTHAVENSLVGLILKVALVQFSAYLVQLLF